MPETFGAWRETSRAALDLLLAGRHDDPFFLAGQPCGPKGTFARTLIPGAEKRKPMT
jgi:1,4-alpha-glucan branching enzyme